MLENLNINWMLVKIIGGVLVAVGVVAAFLIQGHSLSNCRKQHTADLQVIGALNEQIRHMTSEDNRQKVVTTKNVEKVVTVPGPTKVITKTIHDAPLPPNCASPALSKDAYNAF
jgi:hypothetical protein